MVLAPVALAAKVWEVCPADRGVSLAVLLEVVPVEMTAQLWRRSTKLLSLSLQRPSDRAQNGDFFGVRYGLIGSSMG
jgi:hypothetical protein